MVHMLHVQYIITEIRNGCQTAIQPFLSKINPKIDFFSLNGNLTRFHEHCLKTCRVILLTKKRTDGYFCKPVCS